ncbi:MAG: hypothetical protein SFZ02_06370 [bacterium]|nr:hypothetical protein [bacterium]
MKKMLLLVIVFVSLTGCAVWRTPSIARIALLAPFEGRYRDIGYSAIYPARLALKDGGLSHLELVAVDDGGTLQTAQDRARALLLDETIKAVMVLGYDSADEAVQSVFGDMPIIIIGEWASTPASDHIFMLTNPQISTLLTDSTRIDITDASAVDVPFIGGEVFALPSYPELRQNLDEIQIITSGALASPEFADRLIASDIYVPPPTHLSLLVYDATRLLGQVIPRPDITREGVYQALRDVDYMGEGGRIAFDENGYWIDAPIYTYMYENGVLVAAD